MGGGIAPFPFSVSEAELNQFISCTGLCSLHLLKGLGNVFSDSETKSWIYRVVKYDVIKKYICGISQFFLHFLKDHQK